MDDLDWRVRCAERTAASRRGQLGCRLLDAGGQPVAGRSLSLHLQQPNMRVGSCVASGTLARADADGERYRDFLQRRCGILVDENDAKWYSAEAERGVIDWSAADRIADFANAHAIPLRGHCLFWDREKWVHDWVRALDDTALRAAVLARCREAVTHFRGRVTCWDVFNEMLDGGYFERRLPGIRREVFALAHELDPGAALFVNEFGILGGGDKLDRYCRLLDELLDAGVPVGGIGIQEHACERLEPAYQDGARQTPQEIERLHQVRLEPERFWADLDRLAAYGLPIHLTEVSCKQPDAGVRATGLECLLRCAMAHPAVEAVLLWGFWEGRHWLGGEAALIDQAWTPTAAGERVLQVLDEWTTDTTATSDADGFIAWDGWAGDYRVTVDGQQWPLTVGRDQVVDLRLV